MLAHCDKTNASKGSFAEACLMAKELNGRFFPEDYNTPSDDPEKDFPITDTVYDHSGAPRHFTLVGWPHHTRAGSFLFASRTRQKQVREWNHSQK